MRKKIVAIGSLSLIFVLLLSGSCLAKKVKRDLIKSEYEIAYSAYNKLKALEEAQDWNQYFQMKDALLEKIATALDKALNLAKQNPRNPYGLEAAYLNWELKSQESAYKR